MHPLLPALALALTALTLMPTHAQGVAEPAQATSVAGQIAWRSLNAEQRAALKPLEKLWPTLGADQQRKWVALTQNFSRMTPDERATLQSRMTEWVNLTPAQRTQARLNFGEVRKVPTDEKRAKWEEYQALPEEERERLARDRPKLPAGAAPALRPAPVDRILRPTRSNEPPARPDTLTPGSVRPTAPVNRHTLLPQAPAQPRPVAPQPQEPPPQPAPPDPPQPAPADAG